VAIVTAAAVALRIPYLGNQSLWYDETFTHTIVTSRSIADVWHNIRSTEGTPPLYYLLTWGWAKLFGIHSDAALRATAGIAGAASAPVAFAALRRLVGERAALAAAALVAASPMLVWYSLDARAYALLVLLSLVSLWAMSLILERPTRRRGLAWALAAAGAIWTHYFAAFLVAAEVAVLLWRLPAARVATLAWTALAGALVAPLVTVLSAQSDTRTDHIGALPLGSRLGQAGRQLAMGPNVPRAWLEATGLALAAAGVAAGALAARREPRLRVPLAIAAIAIGLPLFLSVTGIEDRLLARNLLIAYPCLAAIAAVGLVRLRAVPVALLVAVGVATTLWVEGDWRYQNADWRGAARTLPPSAARDLVAVFPKLDRQVAQLYLERRYVANGIQGAVWAVVAPARIERRDLTPVTGPPTVPPGYVRAATRTHHGFRLVELRPRRAVTLPPDALGQDVLGALPALLVP
jgi:uncharacterized membrane protein